MGNQCTGCCDTTSEPDEICPLCKAEMIQDVADYVEAILKARGVRIESVSTYEHSVIVRVFKPPQEPAGGKAA